MLAPDLNVILVTVDTLRLDTGFAGYDKPTTPNLDKLAEKSVVFDRAYSLASYTGKSVGPLLIGKYPSETDRDGGHFNKYSLEERLRRQAPSRRRAYARSARRRTGTSPPWSGLSQGMDVWDMSAKPDEGQGENDTSITSDKLSDAALRLLAQAREHGAAASSCGCTTSIPTRSTCRTKAHRTSSARARRRSCKRARCTTARCGSRTSTSAACSTTSPRSRGASGPAIIVTSDHGEAFGEHNMSWHGADLWEVLVRVPLVIYVPGREAASHRRESAATSTWCRRCSTSSASRSRQPGELSGRSMIDDIARRRGPYEERDVYIDMPVGPYTPMRKAIIVGDMKLLYAGGTSYQLFDSCNDPDEKKDLSQDDTRLAPMVQAFETERARRVEIEVKPDAP